VNGNGARNGASNGAVTATVTLPHDPVAELMEQVANGRVRPRDAAAQVRREVLVGSAMGQLRMTFGCPARTDRHARTVGERSAGWPFICKPRHRYYGMSMWQHITQLCRQ